MKRTVLALILLVVSSAAFAANGLRVVSAGPVGEVATLAEANEVRVVFSEPMVVVGKIPNPVTAPWFRIEPAVKGTFRWSGTTTLIFTPEPRLPFATQYRVTIDKSAKAVSGKTLDQSYSFNFTTPTVKLQSVDWYRKGGKIENGLVIALQFNQPVDVSAVLPQLQVRTNARETEAPFWTPEGTARVKRLEPAQWTAYEAKLAKTRQTAQSDGANVLVFAATDWDKERFPVSKEQVVVETRPGVAPETQLEVLVRGQEYPIDVEPAFFVASLGCTTNCDPETNNPIGFRTWTGVPYDAMKKATKVWDVTNPAKEVLLQAKAVERDYDFPANAYSLDELGYTLQPARTYAVRVDPSLVDANGQKLGYAWMAVIDNAHRSAFVSFGDGHGVWESSGGPLLPFHSRNYKSVTQWLAPFTIENALPIMRRMREQGFTIAPPDAKPQKRAVSVTPDKIQSLGFDLSPAIGKDNVGLAWAAVQPGEKLPDSPSYDANIRATLVQATNLGLSVKDSPQNTVVLVTALDTARPVAGAKVTIRDRDNKVFWTGATDANGLAVAPKTDLRRAGTDDDSWRALSELHFLVSAEKDGDVAYVGSDWNDGVMPWDFGLEYNVNEADPLLRGTIFTDRGVYKLGEEIHFKLIARADTPNGMQLMPQGTKVELSLRDSQNRELDARTVSLSAWSSAEWTFRLPAEAPLGTYYVTAKSDRRGELRTEFLVAAYRRPEFRVDTTLTANSSLAGTKLTGTIRGRYLFGGAMNGRPVKWTYTKQLLDGVPSAISDRFPSERWSFLGVDEEAEGLDFSPVTLQQKEAKLNASGELRLTLDTDKAAGHPYAYRLEGAVTDVTRQQIAGRASFRVDPAPWYIGVRRPPYFAEAKNGVNTEIVAAGLDGLAVAGVTVKVELKKLQWTSVRQAEGDGFYGWNSERKEVDAGDWTVTTQAQPVPLQIALKEGGEYLLRATATDGQGRTTTTRVWFYALGEGYTAWAREDHNRIELVPEKTTYRPGETARIMIKSPWEKATALLTTEREGVRTWKQFELTSTQQTITVPITEKDIPNFFVSVLLVKGRTQQDPGRDGSDPGKPAFRLGYVELTVEDAAKRLAVDVKADRDEFRPASKAKIEVNVKDAQGRPSQSEVTLWAVDYGVLSLTDYRTPDVLDSIWLRKALQVSNEDSRQRIVSRRVLTPKGATDGGGGGKDAGPGMMRKDFRVLAFWLGSLTTDKNGLARTEVTLPESLTTYRVMAVAGDKASRFGWAQNELRINQPLMLTPSWPRFLAAGDKAHFGGVVHNQSKSGGTATVSIKSLDPNVVDVSGEQQVAVPPGGSVEVRFDAIAKSVGSARIQMRVQMGSERDAFEDTIPVRVLVSPETVAAYGEAKPQAQETLAIPEGVVPGFGGLHVQLASTAMVGLSEGASYLVQYPYGCAEQRASGALALVLTSDLGDAFTIPGVDTAKNRPIAQSTLNELRRYQCGDGGFAYWPGDCKFASPYLTSYVLHVMQIARRLGYTIDETTLTTAYEYLERELGQPRPASEALMPAYTAWQSFVVKVLAEGGRNVDSHVNRVYEHRDRMPVFALAYLVDALHAKGEKSGARMTELRRRITSSILPEGGHAFVNELNDPYLEWFWSSNVRSTAIVLGTMVRTGNDEQLVKQMVRWLMRVRKAGRWEDTQENAWAMLGLIDYYKRYESEVPDFTGLVTMGQEALARQAFKGRSADAKTFDFTMQQLLSKGTPSAQLPVTFAREGTGTLFYLMRLRYASTARLDALDHGVRVERTYSLNSASSGGDKSQTTFKAGDLIKVTVRVRNTKERRFVAITDPIPAGTEPVDTWFATTASELVQQQNQREVEAGWMWWQRGGWDHIERHDDRVNLFATRLAEGEHTFTYLLRATTAGTFITAPMHAEEMYEPEVFGRTGTVTVEVQK